jgi:hypothetical protein
MVRRPDVDRRRRVREGGEVQGRVRVGKVGKGRGRGSALAYIGHGEEKETAAGAMAIDGHGDASGLKGNQEGERSNRRREGHRGLIAP